MRARGGLWMILDRENWQGPMPHTLKGLVVEVDMGYLNLRIFDGIYIYTEAVVLGGNLHLACQKILYRVVCTTVTEFQLIGLAAKGKPQELVAQANPEDGIVWNQAFDGVNGIGDRLGVPGAIGKYDAIGIHGPDFLSAGMSWYNRHIAPPLG